MIEHRIRLGCGAFDNLSEIVKATNIPINRKRRTFEQCVPTVMVYGVMGTDTDKVDSAQAADHLAIYVTGVVSPRFNQIFRDPEKNESDRHTQDDSQQKVEVGRSYMP